MPPAADEPVLEPADILEPFTGDWEPWVEGEPWEPCLEVPVLEPYTDTSA